MIGQDGGRHELGVGIDVGDGGNAEAEEFVLRVLGDDIGVADAVKFDTARVHQGGNGVGKFIETAKEFTLSMFNSEHMTVFGRIKMIILRIISVDRKSVV